MAFLSEKINAWRILVEKLKQRDIFESVGICGSIMILKSTLKMYSGGVTELIHVLLNRAQWRTVGKMAMNFWIPSVCGKFLA